MTPETAARRAMHWFLIAATTTLLPHTASARVDDTQIWTSAAIAVPLSGPVFATGEASLRFTDQASDYAQSVLRVGLGYRISDKISVMAGYTHQRRHPNAPTDIDGIYQQVQWAMGDLGGFKLSSTTRLEQHWTNAGGDTGWRLRPTVRLVRPITRGSKISVLLGAAVYLQLRNTDWGSRRGVDQFRLSTGLQVPITKHVNLEAGYLNRYSFRRPEDRMDHIGTIHLSTRF